RRPCRPARLAGAYRRDRQPEGEAADRRSHPPHPQERQGARHPHAERGRRAPLARLWRALCCGRRRRRYPCARRRCARRQIQDNMNPEIIITARGHAGTMATLQAEFTAHLLADAPDRAAFLKQHAATVRGVATFGPMTVDGKFMDTLPRLEIISNFGVGVDAINLEDAKKRGIIVTNTPDVLNEAVADTALALVLNTVRRFPRSEQYLRAGNWASRGPYPLTTDAGGKVLGILGLGRIGEAIAKRALACGMQIRYHNRRKKDVPYPYDPDPIALAKNSDVLMVVTPGGPETAKLVSAAVLDAVGKDGYVVNIARGSVID